MGREHHYVATVRWTGNTGEGTANYRAYSRDHDIELEGKAPIAGSSDPAFRGDRARVNPEEMLVASLSSCHMLWFLHLATTENVVVTAYEDDAEGVMAETADGGGHFTGAVLRPRVNVKGAGDDETLRALHDKAHHLCFIANSVNFDVRIEPHPVTVEA